MECKTCREKIKEGAKKCNHCESYQDYRRHLNISTTFLSLLVALATILSFGIPYVIKTFENPNSEIKMYLVGQNLRTNEIDIYCVNEGKRPGIIHGASLEFEYKSKTYYLTLRRQFAKVNNKKILEKEDRRERDSYELYPFKTVLIRYVLLENSRPMIINNPKEKFYYKDNDKGEIKNISLRIISTSFKGDSVKVKVTTKNKNIDSLLFKVLKNLPILITKKRL